MVTGAAGKAGSGARRAPGGWEAGWALGKRRYVFSRELLHGCQSTGLLNAAREAAAAFPEGTGTPSAVQDASVRSAGQQDTSRSCPCAAKCCWQEHERGSVTSLPASRVRYGPWETGSLFAILWYWEETFRAPEPRQRQSQLQRPPEARELSLHVGAPGATSRSFSSSII